MTACYDSIPPRGYTDYERQQIIEVCKITGLSVAEVIECFNSPRLPEDEVRRILAAMRMTADAMLAEREE